MGTYLWLLLIRPFQSAERCLDDNLVTIESERTKERPEHGKDIGLKGWIRDRWTTFHTIIKTDFKIHEEYEIIQTAVKEKGVYMPGFLVYAPYLDEQVHLGGLYSDFPYGVTSDDYLAVLTPEDEEYDSVKQEVDPSYPVIDVGYNGSPLRIVTADVAYDILMQIETKYEQETDSYRLRRYRALNNYMKMMMDDIGSEKDPCYVVFYFI
jgi:hypothetical protein